MHSTRRLTGFGRNRLAWPGLAIAAFVLGSILGPAAVSAVTKATDVFVTNDASSPVPVSGTVNVGNLPATQSVSGTVNVGNLPATQQVSGTVDVGTLPAPENVSGGVYQSGSNPPNSSQVLSLPSAIDVTAVMFHSSQLATFSISTAAVGNGYRLVSDGQTVTQSFPNPMHTSTFVVECIGTASCTWQFSVAGI